METLQSVAILAIAATVLIGMQSLWSSSGDNANSLFSGLERNLEVLFDGGTQIGEDVGNRMEDGPSGDTVNAGEEGSTTEQENPEGRENTPADLLSGSDVQDALNTAWDESNPGTGTDPNRHEQGGWIIRNPDGSISIERWPAGSAAGISPTSPPPNAVGSFHTHPNLGGDWEPAPSDADKNWVAAKPETRAPHFVVSKDTIYTINADGSVTESPRS